MKTTYSQNNFLKLNMNDVYIYTWKLNINYKLSRQHCGYVFIDALIFPLKVLCTHHLWWPQNLFKESYSHSKTNLKW